MIWKEDLKAEDYNSNSKNTVCLLGSLKKFLYDHNQNAFQSHYLSLDYKVIDVQYSNLHK